MYHVPIMLRKVVEPPPGILNDEELLRKILAEVRAIKAKKAAKSGVEPKDEQTAALKEAAKKPRKRAVKKEVA
jgi:hypothetical protein